LKEREGVYRVSKKDKENPKGKGEIDYKENSRVEGGKKPSQETARLKKKTESRGEK